MTAVDEAAQKYMAHKGYPDIVPIRVEKVHDEDCWYYLYELDDDMDMELEVDFVDGRWVFTAFLESD